MNINLDDIDKILADINREDQAARKIQRVFREKRKQVAAAKIIQKYFRYRREKWHMLLYNGVIRDDELGGHVRDMFDDMTRKQLPKVIKEVSILYDPSRVEMTYTREYGIKGSSTSFKAIRWSVFYNNKAHTVTVYKNGDIHFTGGYGNSVTVDGKNVYDRLVYQTPNDVLKIALGRWPSTNKKAVLNNITIQKKFPRIFNLDSIHRMFPKSRYEIEIAPFLTMKYNGVTLKIFRTGVIQATGITNPIGVRDAINSVNMLVSALPTAGSANTTYAPKTSKVLKRKNQNIAPNVKSRATTCPKDKCPVPNTFEGKCPEGFYLAPNPQGFPCCYKIPVKTAYKRNKIVTAFAKLGIKIPDHTKRVFNIRNVNNANKPTLVSGHVGNYRFTVSKNRSGSDVFKIDSRQCKRYTIQKLVDIAMKFGLVQYAKSRDKDTLCTAIFRHAATKGLLNPKNNVPRIGGRLCTHYTKDELRKVVRKKYGITLTSETLAGMCAELKQRLKTPSPSPSSSSSSSVNSSFARNLEKAVRSRSSSVNSNFARNLEKAVRPKTPSPSPNNVFADFDVKKYLRKHTNRKNFTNAEINSFKKIVLVKAKSNPNKLMNYMRNAAYALFGEKFGPKIAVAKETM